MKYLISTGVTSDLHEYFIDSLMTNLLVDKGDIPGMKDYGLSKIIDGLDLNTSREFLEQRVLMLIEEFNSRNGSSLTLESFNLTPSKITITVSTNLELIKYEINH